MRCAECNKLYYDMLSHIRRHKMTKDEYAAKHGVDLKSITMVPPRSQYDSFPYPKARGQW